ncbi:hypothetical protein P43SY_007994 [Pythium insidiosum]|uniref:TIR domain-containing protein n=1 Tax=Pythium insidiosum TaxID=114742 RepID=A0AAD5LQS0_PYTIN|nr:hypothetical protein P43SY_007994 [Pythium insidiosum]
MDSDDDPRAHAVVDVDGADVVDMDDATPVLGSPAVPLHEHEHEHAPARPLSHDPCLIAASLDSLDDDEVDELHIASQRSIARSQTWHVRSSLTAAPTVQHPSPAVRKAVSTLAVTEPHDFLGPLSIRVKTIGDAKPPLRSPKPDANLMPSDRGDGLPSDLAAVHLSASRASHDVASAVAMDGAGDTQRGASPVAPGPHCWPRCSREALRRWYGRVLNSYFAFWLVSCSLAVAALETVAVLGHIFMPDKLPSPDERPTLSTPELANLTSDELIEFWLDSLCPEPYESITTLHFVALPTVLLALPVLFPSSWSELYRARSQDRRIVRRPYLLLCEPLVTGEIIFLIYFAIAELRRIVWKWFACDPPPSNRAALHLVTLIALWCVLWWQVIVFCRFLAHLKLQAGGLNDARHTSGLGAGFLGMVSSPFALCSERRRQLQTFKKRLYSAAARGDAVEVQRLIASAPEDFGVDDPSALYRQAPVLWLYACASSLKNPLHVAAMRGDLDTVRVLLDHGWDVNALDKVARVNFNLGLVFRIVTRLLMKTQDRQRSPLRSVVVSVLLPPLHGAAAAGHVPVVRELLARGADVNALPRASFYYPAAVVPAIFVADDPQVLRLLVAHGANFLHIATTSLPGFGDIYATPLQRSAFTQRSANTEFLLECGADVALTPLHAAAASERDDPRRVRALLGRGTHVDSLGERVAGVHRRTPLHWAAVVGNAVTAAQLLAHGADPNARDRYGRTPLHWAARNNHAAVVRQLMDHGVDAKAEDDAGVPVLAFAAGADGVGVEVVAALLAHGASLRSQLSITGDTPLHVALQRENRATALALIKCGANLLLENHAGRRAVDCTTSTELQFTLKKEAGTRDVMISYTHTHFALAARVREYLESQGGLTCWMDTMDPSGIGGGAVWREEIARGIHNCSLVLSIVCEGYDRSQWCLKELALARQLRKPVLALVVEEPSNPLELDALVPPRDRVPFRDFIRGPPRMRAPRCIEFDVDSAAFDTAWRAVLPRIRAAMASERLLDGELEAQEPATDKAARLPRLSQLRPSTRPVVLLFSPLKKSLLRERLARDLERVGFDSLVLEVSERERRSSRRRSSAGSPETRPHSPDDWAQQFAKSKLLVLLLETENSAGADGSSPALSSSSSALSPPVSSATTRAAAAEVAREAASAVTLVLRAAQRARPRVTVFPVVAQANFLSFSHLYTLARSELLYVVDGLSAAKAAPAVLRQLRQHATSMALPPPLPLPPPPPPPSKGDRPQLSV